MSRSRTGGNPVPWEPMTPAVKVAAMTARMRAAAVAALTTAERTAEEAEAELDRLWSKDEVWRNRRYVVHVDRREDGSVSVLSIRRDDRKPVHDWRELQRIKNEIAGPEVEGFELYPRMSRLMDTSNQYWIFCLPPGADVPAGQGWREVKDAGEVEEVGAVQRPLPEDWR